MAKTLKLSDGTSIRISGRLFRTAAPTYQWNVDIRDPECVLKELRESGCGADVLTFSQRMPVSRPRFGELHWEWDNVAAIPVSSYEHWFEHQLHRNPRNKLSKAKKLGLEVKIVPFDAELIRQIKEIQDDTPVRQGRKYVHYKKSLETVRKGYESFLDQSTFLLATYKSEALGFLKLTRTSGYARSMGLLAKLKHRELGTMNALIAKSVEICAEEKIPYFVYGKYDYGKESADTVADFKFYNGFEHVLLPRYYIPLTWRGRLMLRLGLQHGVFELFPKRLVQSLRDLRAKYYAWRFSVRDTPEGEESQPKATTS